MIWSVAAYRTTCGRCGASVTEGETIALVTSRRLPRCGVCIASWGAAPNTPAAAVEAPAEDRRDLEPTVPQHADRPAFETLSSTFADIEDIFGPYEDQERVTHE